MLLWAQFLLQISICFIVIWNEICFNLISKILKFLFFYFKKFNLIHSIVVFMDTYTTPNADWNLTLLAMNFTSTAGMNFAFWKDTLCFSCFSNKQSHVTEVAAYQRVYGHIHRRDLFDSCYRTAELAYHKGRR